MNFVKPEPKLSLCRIKKDTKSPMNQSKLEASTYSRRKERGNMHDTFDFLIGRRSGASVLKELWHDILSHLFDGLNYG